VAEVLSLGADVEQEIAWRRRCFAWTVPELAEAVELRRSSAPGDETLPGVGADGDDAAQGGRFVTVADASDEGGDGCTDVTHAGGVVGAWSHDEGEKERAAAGAGEDSALAAGAMAGER
jgi:hypothetical protein